MVTQSPTFGVISVIRSELYLRKNPVFLDTRAMCSELPANLSTMFRTEYARHPSAHKSNPSPDHKSCTSQLVNK